jgi:hypothetical protein
MEEVTSKGIRVTAQRRGEEHSSPLFEQLKAEIYEQAGSISGLPDWRWAKVARPAPLPAKRPRAQGKASKPN